MIFLINFPLTSTFVPHWPATYHQFPLLPLASTSQFQYTLSILKLKNCCYFPGHAHPLCVPGNNPMPQSENFGMSPCSFFNLRMYRLQHKHFQVSWLTLIFQLKDYAQRAGDNCCSQSHLTAHSIRHAQATLQLCFPVKNQSHALLSFLIRHNI